MASGAVVEYPLPTSPYDLSPDATHSFNTSHLQETATLLPANRRRRRVQASKPSWSPCRVVFWSIIGSIGYIFISTILTISTTLCTTLYMLIGHAILNMLPHTDLPIDYPLLYLYTKVGVAGGLVIGSLSGLITSALLILAILASISSQSSDAKEEMDKVKRRVSAVIIGSDDGQNPSHSTQLASLSRMTGRLNGTPSQPHIEAVPENESQPSQPAATTTAQVINSGADAMSWAVAGPLGVYALQFYYDHIQPSTEMDVSSLVDPLQAGMAIGLGRIICYTFITALKRKT